MAWVIFNVKQGSSPSLADGEVNFSFTLSANNTTLASGASLQYRPSANANPTTVFTTAKSYTAQNGSFSLDSVTLPHRLPLGAAGNYHGGKYNTLASIVFTPATSGTGVISATFEQVGLPGSTDDPCNWDANATSPIPAAKPVKKRVKAVAKKSVKALAKKSVQAKKGVLAKKGVKAKKGVSVPAKKQVKKKAKKAKA